MRKLIFLAVIAFGGLLSAVAAQDKPVLRSEVRTLSDIVTVGDFYSNAGEKSDVPLFRAPDLGTTGNVPANLVAQRAQAAGLLAAGTDGLSTVVVRRIADTYHAERFKELVRSTLSRQDASINPSDLDVTFHRPPDDVHANPRSDDPVRVERILWSRTDGRFDIYLTVHAQYGDKTVNLRGVAREMMEVAALTQPLRRGHILKREDLTTVKMARSQVPARAVVDAGQLVGLAAKNSLRANSPLSRQDFERPVLIARGEKLTLTYEVAGMKLTTRGQAMDDGAKGDTIDVMNLQSRRIVPAIVKSRGHVRVEPNTPAIASLDQRIN
ncbi:flagella basal body P-ring formation protein FlgA [Roseibium hamelinense]|uniref:Flagella basal body P-ring formation protein FlgA n=1 Tax=Roseibium hamelinense TaxID=150831 RepID=A0A562TAH5_9HYPH|nr:flagellar basal body P-ring formation chaperone FlgA [Roseibium hamelinense]MTI45253.1 flagellar basal body P-ring formation protein FlgA [Roseibium hamelinense]TWI90383.1 flagella basal body P-ring formation protein FlgA [Roseibium hamelinense]